MAAGRARPAATSAKTSDASRRRTRMVTARRRRSRAPSRGAPRASSRRRCAGPWRRRRRGPGAARSGWLSSSARFVRSGTSSRSKLSMRIFLQSTQPRCAVVHSVYVRSTSSGVEIALCIVKMLHTSGRPGSVRRRRFGSVNAPRSLFQNTSRSSKRPIVLPFDLLIFACPSSPMMRGAAERRGCGSGKIGPKR